MKEEIASEIRQLKNRMDALTDDIEGMLVKYLTEEEVEKCEKHPEAKKIEIASLQIWKMDSEITPCYHLIQSTINDGIVHICLRHFTCWKNDEAQFRRTYNFCPNATIKVIEEEQKCQKIKR